VLADLMTMREFTHRHLSDLSIVFMGDVGNNVARSLTIGALKVGADMRLCGPRECWPDDHSMAFFRQVGASNAGTFRISERPEEMIYGADFIYTDV
jgi:ornithine carbamoyltransferase